jgi:hypothetical protein
VEPTDIIDRFRSTNARMDLRDRVERCEQDIDELKRRVY